MAAGEDDRNKVAAKPPTGSETVDDADQGQQLLRFSAEEEAVS